MPAATRPRYGGVLIVQTAAALRSPEPAAPEDSFTEKMNGLVYETLVKLDPSGKPQPGLARSWEEEDGGRRWRIRLPPGVICHDGSELTAEIVAASLSSANSDWEIRAEGNAVVIRTARPSPDVPADLAQPRQAIVLRRADGTPAGTDPFRLTQWEPGRTTVLECHEAYREGRPFLDGVTIQLGREVKDRLMDLEPGRAGLVELRPDEVRRAIQRGFTIWSSAPLVLMALVFQGGRPAAGDPRLREALALSIDRAAIHAVLLQKQGEPAWALLPHWMTGYAFLFSKSRDLGRARGLAGALPATSKQLTLACNIADPLARAVADRVALNARDAGLAVRVVAEHAAADLRLAEVRLGAHSPAEALSGIVRALRLSEQPQLPADSLESLHAAEAAFVRDFRVIPLFHVPELYAVSPQVKTRGVPGVLPSGQWRFEDVWLEAPKP